MLFFNRRKRYFFEYENDIHAHVLPGLDDGVGTMDEAVMIVKQMGAGGIETIDVYAPRGLRGYDKYTERCGEYVVRVEVACERVRVRIGFGAGPPDGGVYAGGVGKGRNHGIEPGGSVS